jgi:hypothetical protein
LDILDRMDKVDRISVNAINSLSVHSVQHAHPYAASLKVSAACNEPRLPGV